ncbi:MAG: LysR family transcriptional regulator [Reyranella sp.]|nr:MAG: LysR family transcriptional regulator [Reyranella sp.]
MALAELKERFRQAHGEASVVGPADGRKYLPVLGSIAAGYGGIGQNGWPSGGTIAVEMHQIRYFLAVCETLNFTRAAETCHVSQPSLTRAIKGLEDELGGPLFRRERNNTHLTGLGEMMRPHLSQVLIETEAAKERAKSFGRLEDVELKLGMMCTIGPRRFVPFLQTFRDRHPKVRLVVQDGSNHQLQERLAQGELDVAIYGQPDEIDERFHARRLYDERFVIGVGPGHPFDKQNVVCAKDLDGQNYVNRLQCEFFDHARRLFRENGAKTVIVFRSDRDDWVQSMVMAGLGFTFIPEYAVTMPGLSIRPLIEPEITRSIQVVTVRGRPHVPAVGAFVHEVLAFPWMNAST